MILRSCPDDFASAYADNCFSFSDVDATTPAELVFYDGSGNAVAARRYVGSPCIDSSPTSLLLRQLAPSPLAEVEKCQFVRPEGRDATLSVGYDDGGALTPEILFTASRRALAANSIMGGEEQWRTIASGECDEVAFVLASGATIAARLFVDGAEQAPLCTFTAPAKGVVVFALSADDVMAQMGVGGANGAGDLSEGFDLRFEVDGRVCAVLHYRLRSAHRSDVRLAWLTADGAIGYHTFHRPTKSLRRTSKEHTTLSGRQVASVESWTEWRLVSEVLSAPAICHLSDALSSPRVWLRREDGLYEPHIVLLCEAPLEGDGAGRLSLTLRSAESRVFTL